MRSVTRSDRIFITATTIPDAAVNRDVLFDTNVWLRVHGCLTDIADRRTVTYSPYYKKLLDAGRKIYLPHVIVSEFVNVSLKIKADGEGWTRAQGKIHQHAKYRDWITDISDNFHHISSDCMLVDDAFSDTELSGTFGTCGAGNMDFNDALIAGICLRLDALLVTDDADFGGQAVSIVTGNRRLANSIPSAPAP